jgi:uncharacterized protein YndB with AHSA1/START domain
MNTDRIEKQILLRAPQERIWRAISDSAQFGSWFGERRDSCAAVAMAASAFGSFKPCGSRKRDNVSLKFRISGTQR